MALFGRQGAQVHAARCSPYTRHQEWECSGCGTSNYLTRSWCRECWQPPVVQRPDASAVEDDEAWGSWSSRAAPSASAPAIAGLAHYDTIFSDGALLSGGTTAIVPRADQAEDAPSSSTPSPPPARRRR